MFCRGPHVKIGSIAGGLDMVKSQEEKDPIHRIERIHEVASMKKSVITSW